MPAKLASDVKEVVFLLHGIRDRAAWHESIRPVLEEGNPERRVFPIKYGYVSVLRFLSPLPMYFLSVRYLERQIQFCVRQYPNAKFSAIGHSFGTYILTRAMRRSKYIKFHRVVLCGSVVPCKFGWEKVANSFTQYPEYQLSDFVLNDCGNADIWPALAEIASFRYGRSGVDGFAATATNRTHEGGHSFFLSPNYVRKYWKPFFDTGTIDFVDTVDAGGKLPRWLHFLSLPLIVFATRCLVFGLYLLPLIYALVALDSYLHPPKIKQLREGDFWSNSILLEHQIPEWRPGQLAHFHEVELKGGNKSQLIVAVGDDEQTQELVLRLKDNQEWELPPSAWSGAQRVCVAGEVQAISRDPNGMIRIELHNPANRSPRRYMSLPEGSPLTPIHNDCIVTMRGPVVKPAWTENGKELLEIRIQLSTVSVKLSPQSFTANANDIRGLEKEDLVNVRGRVRLLNGAWHVFGAEASSQALKSGDHKCHYFDEPGAAANDQCWSPVWLRKGLYLADVSE